MCHHERKFPESFARQTMTRVPHPVSSPDLLPHDFWFFCCAKERTNDQIVRSKDDLEHILTEVWEVVSGHLFESVLSERMSRSEWVTEHEGEYYIYPHLPNENRIEGSPAQSGESLLSLPLYH
jgi:hypothetical protein